MKTLKQNLKKMNVSLYLLLLSVVFVVRNSTAQSQLQIIYMKGMTEDMLNDLDSSIGAAVGTYGISHSEYGSIATMISDDMDAYHGCCWSVVVHAFSAYSGIVYTYSSAIKLTLYHAAAEGKGLEITAWKLIPRSVFRSPGSPNGIGGNQKAIMTHIPLSGNERTIEIGHLLRNLTTDGFVRP